MTKKAAKRDTSISIDLMMPAMKKGLFALAAVTGVNVSSRIREFVYKEVREAAEKGIITLPDDKK